jgi:hypothetical protein
MKITRYWRKFHDEELHNWYLSPNVIRMIKSRRMMWAGYIACIGEKKNTYRVLIGKPERKDTTWKTDVDEWIILDSCASR